MDDKQANLKAAAMRMALLTFAMRGFAFRVLKLAFAHNILTDEILAEIKHDIVIGLKNSHAEGISIEAEAEIFGQAVHDLEQLLDIVIEDGRKGYQSDAS